MFWYQSVHDSFPWMQRELHPKGLSLHHNTVVVMNVGHHPHSLAEPGLANLIVDKARESHIDQFIWQTTTGTMGSLHDLIFCGFANVTCVNTSWTVLVNTSTLMWDPIHYRAPIYNVLNIELLHHIRK